MCSETSAVGDLKCNYFALHLSATDWGKIEFRSATGLWWYVSVPGGGGGGGEAKGVQLCDEQPETVERARHAFKPSPSIVYLSEPAEVTRSFLNLVLLVC